MAARADITEKFLSQIERGKAGLSGQTLIALCDILEITPNDVLLPDAARVLEEPIGPLLKGMSQRQLQDCLLYTSADRVAKKFILQNNAGQQMAEFDGSADRTVQPVSYTHLSRC